MATGEPEIEKNEVSELTRVSQLEYLKQSLGVTPVPELVLSEENIDSRIDRFLALGAQAYAGNTMKAWRADWTLWCAYCDANSHPRLPATVEMLRNYLHDRIVGDFCMGTRGAVGMTRESDGSPSVPAHVRRATLERSVSTLRKAHRIMGVPFCGDTTEGELAIRGQLRRLAKRQDQKQGLTYDVLQKILAATPDKGMIALRDRVVLWMGYSAMARRSELVRLTFQDIKPGKGDAATVLLASSKTDKDAKGALLYLRPEAVAAIRAWQTETGITHGPILRALQSPGKRAGRPSVDRALAGEDVPHGAAPGLCYAMTDHHVARVLKRHAVAAELDPAIYSGHSGRIGAAQDMAAAGFGIAEIMLQGRWKSEAQLMRYIEHLLPDRGAMAKLSQLQQPPQAGAASDNRGADLLD